MSIRNSIYVKNIYVTKNVLDTDVQNEIAFRKSVDEATKTTANNNVSGANTNPMTIFSIRLVLQVAHLLKQSKLRAPDTQLAWFVCDKHGGDHHNGRLSTVAVPPLVQSKLGRIVSFRGRWTFYSAKQEIHPVDFASSIRLIGKWVVPLMFSLRGCYMDWTLKLHK